MELAAFYVINANELERGEPNVLKWIRYPLPNKQDLINRLNKAVIFSKFDMKSRYYQTEIVEKDQYKIAFIVPFGHYEWNVMALGLKNAPSEFQNIMKNILNPYSESVVVYLDNALLFSESIGKHIKHLKTFKHLIKQNGIALSERKNEPSKNKNQICRP